MKDTLRSQVSDCLFKDGKESVPSLIEIRSWYDKQQELVLKSRELEDQWKKLESVITDRAKRVLRIKNDIRRDILKEEKYTNIDSLKVSYPYRCILYYTIDGREDCFTFSEIWDDSWIDSYKEKILREYEHRRSVVKKDLEKKEREDWENYQRLRKKYEK